jgi:hypothetical protein
MWSGKPLRQLSALACLLLGVAAASQAQEHLRSIPDVKGQFMALKHHGEWLGFQPGGYTFPGFHKLSDTIRHNTSSHWQGIQRYNTPDGTPFLLVTHSSNATQEAGRLAIVMMASRDKDGERMRSNRLLKGSKTEDTQPPGNDRIVKMISFPDYQHVGGTQLIGNILAVPAEELINASSGLPQSRIYFYDLSNIANPSVVATLDIQDHKAGVVGITDLPDGRYLLAVTWGDGQQVEFYKSTSGNWADPGFAFQLHTGWNRSQLQGGTWPFQLNDPLGIPLTYSHQTLNFIKQDDGQLFLLGTHNTAGLAPVATGGDDVGVLYQVGGTGDGQNVTLQVAQGMKFYSRAPGSVDGPLAFKIINFSAAVGAYISPTQELLLYATEHYNLGPGGSIQVAEFRNRDVYRPGSPNYYPTARITGSTSVLAGGSIALDASGSRPAKARQWVELYQDATGWTPQSATLTKQDFNSGGVYDAQWAFSPSSERKRSLVIDEADIGKDDFDDFGKLDQTDGIITPKGFHDTASSVRFWAPPGCGPNLYENDQYGGKVLNLRNFSLPSLPAPAVDKIWTASDLSAITMHDSNGNTTNANDKASSLTLTTLGCSPAPITRYTWSLQPGSVGSLSATSGASVQFNAGNTPGTATVQLQACTAANLCRTASAQLTVVQSGPIIDKIFPRTEKGGGDVVRKNHPIFLDISFSNPDKTAHHQVQVDWGDAPAAAAESLADDVRFFTLQHAYSQAGVYNAVVSISDQNNKQTQMSSQITVTDPAPHILGFALDSPINEGSQAGLTVGFTRTGPAEASIDWGDGSAPEDPRIGTITNNTVVAGHVYADQGTYTVTIQFSDRIDTISQSGQVQVLNVAPVIQNVGIDLLGLTAAFSDPGLADQHTVRVNWDDGTRIDKISVPLGERQFRVTHQYRGAAQGFGKAAYNVLLNLSDGTKATQKTVQINMQPGDLDSDRDVDRNDLGLLLGEFGKTVAESACGSRCDFDGNAKITSQDAAKLKQLCTRPNCATK